MRRLFLAVTLPQSIRDAIGDQSAPLQRRLHDVKWVRPENLHLTLKFLGNTPETQVADIGQACQQLAASCPPMDLALGPSGAFPSANRPNILWVGLDGDIGQLSHLAHLVDRAMEPLGFDPERRPFAPHITIGRARRRTRLPDISGLVSGTGSGTSHKWTVRDFVLVESTLTRAGPIYRNDRSFRLGSGN